MSASIVRRTLAPGTGRCVRRRAQRVPGGVAQHDLAAVLAAQRLLALLLDAGEPDVVEAGEADHLRGDALAAG